MYRINNIFHSLQGEGRNTGRAAAFVRFAGCNLRCPFCDTLFDSYSEMSGEAILQAIAPYPTRFAVLTGGEPTLQADEPLVDLLHRHGYEVAIESNGTRPAPRNIDWLTLSPKEGAPLAHAYTEGARQADELKLVFQEDTDPEALLATLFPNGAPRHLYLQPCDTGDARRNADIVSRCTHYILSHPRWRLSLQTHKLIGIE